MAERAINSPLFNVNKLSDDTNFADGSDLLANKGFTVTIQHVPSGRTIYFKAFIETYNETFSPDWAEETVYGRMDPIYQFKNTTRNITIGLAIPAASRSEAFQNLAKVQALTQFLYPNYTQVGSATTIAQSPLLRLSVMNLAKSQKSWAPNLTHYVPDPANPGAWILQEQPGASRLVYEGEREGVVFESVGGGAITEGLLGVMKSLTINHNLEGDKGVIETTPEDSNADGGILPKLININFDFGVIHEHHLGWDDQGNFSNNAFPYGLDYQTSTGEPLPEPPPSAATAAQAAQAAGPDPGDPDVLADPGELPQGPRDDNDIPAANAEAQIPEAMPSPPPAAAGPDMGTGGYRFRLQAASGDVSYYEGTYIDNVLQREEGGLSDADYAELDAALRSSQRGRR